MIYVSYQPTPPGSLSGPIVQVQRCARIAPEKLSLPVVEVPEWRDDYGTAYRVVDGQVVAKI